MFASLVVCLQSHKKTKQNTHVTPSANLIWSRSGCFCPSTCLERELSQSTVCRDALVDCDLTRWLVNRKVTIMSEAIRTLWHSTLSCLKRATEGQVIYGRTLAKTILKCDAPQLLFTICLKLLSLKNKCSLTFAISSAGPRGSGGRWGEGLIRASGVSSKRGRLISAYSTSGWLLGSGK